jgi:hypothetical protein
VRARVRPHPGVQPARPSCRRCCDAHSTQRASRRSSLPSHRRGGVVDGCVGACLWLRARDQGQGTHTRLGDPKRARRACAWVCRLAARPEILTAERVSDRRTRTRHRETSSARDTLRAHGTLLSIGCSHRGHLDFYGGVDMCAARVSGDPEQEKSREGQKTNIGCA